MGSAKQQRLRSTVGAGDSHFHRATSLSHHHHHQLAHCTSAASRSNAIFLFRRFSFDFDYDWFLSANLYGALFHEELQKNNPFPQAFFCVSGYNSVSGLNSPGSS